MHLLPAAGQLLPDACFAAAGCHGISVHQLLREASFLDNSFLDGLLAAYLMK